MLEVGAGSPSWVYCACPRKGGLAVAWRRSKASAGRMPKAQKQESQHLSGQKALVCDPRKISHGHAYPVSFNKLVCG